MTTFTTPKGLAVNFDLRGTTGAFWPGQEDNYHYCSIFGARSALIGTRLYIDGGYVLSTIPTFGEPNNRLLWVDFDKEFEWGGGPGVQSTPKPSQIPSLIAGTAFGPTQSSKFYIFGGVYKTDNMTSSRFQPPPSVGGELFSYSKDTGEWTQEKTVGYQPQQIALGLWADNNDANVSYFLGGLTNDETTSRLSSIAHDRLIINGLLTLNFTDMSWRNESVAGDPTIRGFMHYIPLGEKGILVKFGGERSSAGRYNSASVLNDISDIEIYDLNTGKWYTQKATGNADLPANRMLGCSVVIAAPDNSSYNIYMMGGTTSFSSPASVGGHVLNDMWILSIPSFNWIKVWSAPPDWGVLGQVCQKLGRSLLMTSLERANRTCVEIVLVYDLEELRWQSKWVPNQDYAVPMLISAIIGGSHSGGATETKPRNGWSSKDLENALTVSNGTGLRRPGPTSTANLHDGGGQVGHSKNTGAIVGGAVGGVLGFFLIIAMMWFSRSRMRNRKNMPQTWAEPELDGNGRPIEDLPGPLTIPELGSNLPIRELSAIQIRPELDGGEFPAGEIPAQGQYVYALPWTQ